MSYQSLLAMLLRVAGVAILVSAVAGIPTTFTSLLTWKGPHDFSVTELVLLSLAAAIPAIVLSLLLILYPSSVVRPPSPESSELARETQWAGHFQATAFSVLGVYFIASALCSAAYYFARLKLYFQVIGSSDAFPKMPLLLPDDFGGFAFTAIQLLVGIALFLGGPGLVRLWARLRGQSGDR